jgi:hypothetical protein
MTSRQMLLCMQFASGYGAEPGAWRLPGANLAGYTDMDQFVRYAQAAERGKIQLLFLRTPRSWTWTSNTKPLTSRSTRCWS